MGKDIGRSTAISKSGARRLRLGREARHTAAIMEMEAPPWPPIGVLVVAATLVKASKATVEKAAVVAAGLSTAPGGDVVAAASASAAATMAAAPRSPMAAKAMLGVTAGTAAALQVANRYRRRARARAARARARARDGASATLLTGTYRVLAARKRGAAVCAVGASTRVTIHMTTGGGGAPSRQLAHRRVREVLAATTEVVGRGIGAEAAGGGSALGASGSGTYIAERGHVTRDGRGTVWCGPRGAVRGLRCAAPPGWTLGAMDRDVETGPGPLCRLFRSSRLGRLS